MCGIAGLLDVYNTYGTDWLDRNISAMTDKIRHRGPDGGGLWRDANLSLALGHRRLSIIDVSENGCQPMISNSQRYVIVYNGEIYNFKEIKKLLIDEFGPMCFRGHSDTEILLAAIEAWGVYDTIPMLNGMFAFAVWDIRERVLHLVRDRVGKKPLYYGWHKGIFMFSSELKGFEAIENSELQINRDALSLLLRVNFIPSPHSIYVGFYKLPPATILSLTQDLIQHKTNFSPYPQDTIKKGSPFFFWSVKTKIEESSLSPLTCTKEEILEQVDNLCRDAVEKRMVSDVPIGAFLSGGIDSSLVVAMMQSLSSKPIKTYSIGFNEGRNEAPFAKTVANYLNTDHTELYFSSDILIEKLCKLPDLCDEPVGDTAILPTFLVSQLARQEVTVALSGDGGDELFAGYPRYIWTLERWCREQRRFKYFPELFKKIYSQIIKNSPECVLRHLPYGGNLQDSAFLLDLKNPEEVYHHLIDNWHDAGAVVLGSQPVRSVVTKSEEWAMGMDVIQRMVYMDLACRLPDSIVSKVDRATMQVSLEARCPLLDYRLIELSMRIPTSMKIQDGKGKMILRELLYRYVPKEMVDRPKAGFKIPISIWLKGPLRNWAEALLDEKRLREEDFFDVKAIRQKWQEHISGVREWHYHLWDVLMFQMWNEKRK